MPNNDSPSDVASRAEELLAKIDAEGKSPELVQELSELRDGLGGALKRTLGGAWIQDATYDDLFRRMTEVVDPKEREVPKDPFAKMAKKHGLKPPRWNT